MSAPVGAAPLAASVSSCQLQQGLRGPAVDNLVPEFFCRILRRNNPVLGSGGREGTLRGQVPPWRRLSFRVCRSYALTPARSPPGFRCGGDVGRAVGFCSSASTLKEALLISRPGCLRRPGPGSTGPRLGVTAATGGSEGSPGEPSDSTGDLSVAMFRFSLGLSFLDDKYIPRVAGAVLGSLLLLNHWLTPYVSTAQQVSELAGSVLALVCIAVPTLDTRLLELKAGKRVVNSGVQQASSRPVFLLSPALSEESAQELAWASYALLRNTNTTSLLLVHRGTVLCARGLWSLGGPADGQGDQKAPEEKRGRGGRVQVELQALQRQLEQVQSRAVPLREALAGEREVTYVPSLGSGWSPLQSLVDGAECILVEPLLPAAALEDSPQPLPVLVLVSNAPRAFSTRDRVWIGFVGKKLSSLELP